MATQCTPVSTVMEAGRRALLARSTSGRGDEEIVLTKARGSLVWDVDSREDIDCTAGTSGLVIPVEGRGK